MFEAVIDRARGAIDKVVLRLTARLAVAVPFVIAFGFATAGATVWLTENYGALTAYWVLAAIFGFVGVVAAAAVSANVDAPEPVAETVHVASAEPQQSSLPQFDSDFLFKAATRVGPIALPLILRLLSKNLPLIVGLLVVMYLLFSDTDRARPGTAVAPVPSP